MEDEKKGHDPEKGFTVRDKRFSAKEESGPAPQENKKEEGPKEQEIREETGPLPEITLTNLILSISTSALIQLGEIEDPVSNATAKNLPLAKQTIDLISLLKDKTKGNRTPDEDRIVENLLYDLRIRYVKASE